LLNIYEGKYTNKQNKLDKRNSISDNSVLDLSSDSVDCKSNEAEYYNNKMSKMSVKDYLEASIGPKLSLEGLSFFDRIRKIFLSHEMHIVKIVSVHCLVSNFHKIC
jgi:hypothetical protein